jgi:DNA polymerase
MSDPRRIERKLRQSLQAERMFGIDAVPLGSADQIAEEQVPSPAPVQRPPAASRGVPPRHEGADVKKPPASEERRPVAARKGEKLTRTEKLQRLQTLDDSQVKGCTKCGLCDSRTNTVFGEGDPDAKLLFIGEGPGQNEDEQGRPFVGRAGELLDRMIVAMGLSREQVYIANVVKCRPPNNRAPTPEEADACADYLKEQIETIQPDVIVTLGGPAMKRILDLKEGITSVRGQWFEVGDYATRTGKPIRVMPTFHPAYLLRSYTKENRTKVWSDLQQVMAALGMTGTGQSDGS